MAEYKLTTRLFSESCSIVNGMELDLFPWLRFLPNQNFKKLTHARDLLDRWIDRELENTKVGKKHPLETSIPNERCHQFMLRSYLNELKFKIMKMLKFGLDYVALVETFIKVSRICNKLQHIHDNYGVFQLNRKLFQSYYHKRIKEIPESCAHEMQEYFSL